MNDLLQKTGFFTIKSCLISVNKKRMTHYFLLLLTVCFIPLYASQNQNGFVRPTTRSSAFIRGILRPPSPDPDGHIPMSIGVFRNCLFVKDLEALTNKPYPPSSVIKQIIMKCHKLENSDHSWEEQGHTSSEQQTNMSSLCAKYVATSINKGADINQGFPLYDAIRFGYHDVVKLLLDEHAIIDQSKDQTQGLITLVTSERNEQMRLTQTTSIQWRKKIYTNKKLDYDKTIELLAQYYQARHASDILKRRLQTPTTKQHIPEVLYPIIKSYLIKEYFHLHINPEYQYPSLLLMK